MRQLPETTHFNPRSPRGERQSTQDGSISRSIFQSTLPARGATTQHWYNWQILPISIHAPREGSDLVVLIIMVIDRYFNPRSPRGERRAPVPNSIILYDISIHAPREGSDSAGATDVNNIGISIHAPREGSDNQIVRQIRQSWHFNPRSPRGERLFYKFMMTLIGNFNPRSPRGERPNRVLMWP